MSVSIPSNNAAFTSSNGGVGGAIVADISYALPGDLCTIEVWMTATSSPILTTPAGWALVGSYISPASGGQSTYNWLYSRIFQTGDPTTVNIVRTGTVGYACHTVGYRSTVRFDANSIYGYTNASAGAGVASLSLSTVTNIAGELLSSGFNGTKSNNSGIGITGTGWTLLSSRAWNTDTFSREMAAYKTAAGNTTLTYTYTSTTSNTIVCALFCIHVRDGVPVATGAQLFCEA